VKTKTVLSNSDYMDPKKQDKEEEPKADAGNETPAERTEVKNANASGLGSMGGHDESLPEEGSPTSVDDY